MAAVKFENVFKIYPNGYIAIKDLCLEIQDGELIVFVGPSGCGKSTALRMLAGLEEISAGKLMIGENIVNDKTPQQRNIAMVFQNYALYPHMTVKQNMEFPLRMMKIPGEERQRRVQEAAERLGLMQLLDRKPKQLSGGQRQRVAMGRAIVRDPAVFLMDEPLSNLDAKMRVQIRTEIVELQRRMGTTTVYVTHDQVEAMTMGDRVAVMRGGELQQVAPPQDLYDYPANIFVASFIGSPEMNIFTTQLGKTESHHWTIDLGEQSLVIDPSGVEKYTELPHYLNQKIIAGLRPEAFFLANAEVAKDHCIQVNVNAVEALGHEMIIYFNAPISKVSVKVFIEDSLESATGNRIEKNGSESHAIMIARIASSRDVHSHTQLTLGVDTSKVYLFTASGKVIA